jgi:hypothetical protein
MLKQKATSAAVDRNLRLFVILAAYSDELISDVVTEASFPCLIAALYSRMLSRLDSLHAEGYLVTGGRLGDKTGVEGGVRGTSMLGVSFVVSMSNICCALSEIILLPSLNVRKENLKEKRRFNKTDSRKSL